MRPPSSGSGSQRHSCKRRVASQLHERVATVIGGHPLNLGAAVWPDGVA
ncbi:hypothetical protein HMPREF1978_00212 [Actinomyces graevenitzii F0530]|uniref:Uncharacterized protein n=1 Tax=Actinomyces graevenitzii F0530 TaxID=1321817 RepID=U1QCC9_9ACTO|nr:hypothetical protein HMPREF1978_00212 [Actinomyces graevenitzii F0530]